MKKFLTTLLVLCFTGAMSQQAAYTLQACLDSAVRQYPGARQLGYNREISDLNLKNIKTGYYPRLNLNAQAHYQSDVTKVPVIIPEFAPPELPNDWYKFNLDVEQLIYDGGATGSQKKLEQASLGVDEQKIMVELYQLKEKIYSWFFTAIYLNKNIAILRVLEKNLDARIEEGEAAAQEGVMLAADVDALKVELFNTRQKITEMHEDINALIEALNIQTGLSIQSADELVLPGITIDAFDFENNRPEYILLDRQQDVLTEMSSLSQSKRWPVLSAFGQAGYGRPGYDMLNVNFDDYYMIGIRLHWNIWDWGKVKREKQVVDLRKGILNVQKETLNQNLRSELARRVTDIHKYEQIIETDQEIVKLQTNVMQTVEAQFTNGTVTSTNYLIELNKLLRANLNLEAHKLQLVFAKYQYITAKGNL